MKAEHEALIDEIVEKTKLYCCEKQDGNKAYVSYNAAVQADLFAPFSQTTDLLVAACECYGQKLQERLKRIKKQSNLIQMDQQHITDETLAHLLIWFKWSKRWGFGLTYQACKQIDLNIDENRFGVKQWIGMVSCWHKRRQKKYF